MLRPRLKSYFRSELADQITLIQEAGVQVTLPNPGGQIGALLDLLDGTRTITDIACAMASHWPDLSPADVEDGITALDEAGLLEDGAASTSLTAAQQERYFSNTAFFSAYASLSTSRYQYQERLRQARVVLLGVGGLGSTLLLNLAGLGVGHVTALDFDRVEFKNLTRQFLYSEAEVGLPKLERAALRASGLNSEVEITTVERRVTGPEDVVPLLPGADLVICGIDTPRDTFNWVNEACVKAGVPFVSGGMQVTRGLYYSVIPGRTGCLACRDAWQGQGDGQPHLASPAEQVNRGAGPVASLIGSFIAVEALRYLTGYAPPVSAGKLWIMDFTTGEVSVAMEWPRVAECTVCGSGKGVGAA